MHVIVIVMVEGHSIPPRLAGLEVNTALVPNKINQYKILPHTGHSENFLNTKDTPVTPETSAYLL